MDLKSTYNKIARDWAKDHTDDDWWKQGTDKYLTFLKPEALILDVGCGAGIKSRYLVDKGFNVVGIDFSEEMVKLAEGRFQSAQFLVKDIKEPLGFDISFDGVFAQAVLLHIPKKEISVVLKNIVAPLKAGGYLYAAVKGLKPGGAEEEVKREEDYGYEYERFFSYFTLDEIKNYIAEAGMRIVYDNVSFSGKTEWIQVIAQK